MVYSSIGEDNAWLVLLCKQANITTMIALPWDRGRQQTSALVIGELTLIAEELFIVMPERILGL